MSILNRPSDGLFNVLIALTKCLMSQGSMPRQKLLDLCIPKSLDPKQDMATKTLNRWLELGIFESTEDGTVSISEQHKSNLNKRRYSLEQLISAVTTQVFSARNNERFWASDENKSADFSRAQSWMLMQDVYVFQPTSYKEVERLVAEQMVAKEYSVFTNDTRWTGFVAWSEFLGFGNSCLGRYTIDPTRVIMPFVLESLSQSPSMPIVEFMDLIAAKIPVLDGGAFRKQVEEKINKSRWQAPKVNEVSTSLSRALIRLNESNILKLENKADAKEKRLLLGKDGRQLETVSHVRIVGRYA